jgi:tRNA nucleotidyltransferase (CCA-adding enzyme)
MDSVGACYLIPAYVYKHAKYGYTPVDRTNHHWSTWVTGHTDHWSIMTIAKHTLGVSILCTRKVKVYHADLQKYGVGLNESRQQRKSLQ